MRYFDTSFLVPLILPEATSDPIAGLLEGLTTEALAVSHWTRIEFSSLLAREVRMGGLSASAAREANSRFESMVAGFFAVLLPDRNDFGRAKEYIGHFETGCGPEMRCIWPSQEIVSQMSSTVWTSC